MKLNVKFTALLVVMMIFIEVTVFSSVQKFAEEVVADVLVKYGEAIAQYDQEKSFSPIMEEARLMRKFAKEPQLLDWVANPTDPQLYAAIQPLLETYRWAFKGNNFYVASTANLGYYSNNKTNDFEEQLFRYQLDDTKNTDRWFFRFVESAKTSRILSSYDENLHINRLWIDHQIKDKNGEVIGVVGTGMEFSRGLEPLLGGRHEGIDTIFIDADEIIQIYRKRDPYFEDDIITGQYQLLPIEDYIMNDVEYAKLKRELISAQDSSKTVSTIITQNNKRYLYVIDHIELLDWYELTVIDMEVIFPNSKFTSLYVVLGGIIILLVVIVNLMLQRWVTSPITELEEKTWIITQPNTDFSKVVFSSKPRDEIGALMVNFENMAKALKVSRAELEEKVQQRTEALDRLANVDSLTELLNRRGMERQLGQEINHIRRDRHRVGLLCIDVDNFKEINDTLGHDKGDQALVSVANCINSMIRDYDSASRWGGDEFLVLIRLDKDIDLEDVAQRLRRTARQIEVSSEDKVVSMLMSVSIGGTELDHTSVLKEALSRADSALYSAKHAGRNCVKLWEDLEPQRSNGNHA
jgi:diguanylate cyclase (GGDEF)-like protein